MPSRPTAFRLALLTGVVALSAACGSAVVTEPPSATGEPATAAPPSGARVPIIIDTDLDVSDVAALAVLLRDPGVDVRAVTVTPTGTGITNCAAGRRLARYVLEELGAEAIPFACGREDAGPDARPFPPEWRTAADAGWAMDMPPRPQSGLPEAAIDLLARAVGESPTAPTVVTLGPWTNLEDAVAADPAFADRIAGIHAMAGAIRVPGNVIVEGVTAEDGLEWNVAADPSAVAALFATSAPISLVPLDATDDVPVGADLGERLAVDHTAAGADLVYELLVRVPGRVGEGQQLWDELAALALSDPDLVTWEETELVAQEGGRLAPDAAGRPVRVAVAADQSGVETALLAALGRGAARTTPFALSGDLTFAWDGTTCSTTPFDAIAPGVVQVTFENTSGAPAGVALAGVRAPHEWSELVELARTLDVETTTLPDWLIEGASVNDETGNGSATTGTSALEPATYGPLCITGTWPDLAFTLGEPFEVPAAP